MNVKLKLYVVSLSAATSVEADEKMTGTFYWEHNAAILTSDSMDTVADQAKIIAFESWPKDRGWSYHSASITEVTKSFVDEVMGLRQAGLMSDAPSEEHRFFKFD